MFVFWGDGSKEAMDLVNAIIVRSTENFNWTFIFILSVVFYVYWSEYKKKDTKAIIAGFALYGVHWLYEIANAIIAHVAGYPLWAVSNASTTFILLIGVCWELSMMFSPGGHHILQDAAEQADEETEAHGCSQYGLALCPV